MGSEGFDELPCSSRREEAHTYSDGSQSLLTSAATIHGPNGRLTHGREATETFISDEIPTANLVIAANFTAEPLEDSLKFWSDHFNIPARPEFAPYNQVFQQLLDAGSAFRKNREGVNIILLALEEWAKSQPSPGGFGTTCQLANMSLESGQAEKCFGIRPRCVLPNGLEIVHLNQYETDYLYQEIFEDQCYLRHGIRLQDGDTVVDIGANIGMFSLFVMSRCRNPRIYAYEPAPMVCELLQANCAAYGTNVRAVNAGVSDTPKTAQFTFYEKSSVFSGFHSDEAEDREAIQAVVRNMLNRESVAGDSLDEYVNELTADRLRQRICECRLTSVTDIIRDHQIDRIHLLKIDAEKSELDIIQGIAERDWPKIDQIVIEIHDRTGETVRRIEKLLNERGYRCAVEHEKLLEHSGLFNLFATRGSRNTEASRKSGVGGQWSVDLADGHQITDNGPHSMDYGLRTRVLEFCAALRSFTTHTATPLVLCVCPRTPGAKADAKLNAALNMAEEDLLSAAVELSNVHTVGSAGLLQRYPVSDYHDPESHRLGHIPFTPEGHAAIGTALVRTIFNLKRRPSKVIVLDCDNTLWKGVCSEDGPLGVEVSGSYRVLQEFMVAQASAGMLLCLCSKNNEKDVLDVFDQRADMALKREHLASWRINWSRKSENIKALANELSLGLDSFIFIDDNPVDCADVRIHCPEVVTLQLPPNPEQFASFLNHIWAFDRTHATEEDRMRTRMYRENTERQRFRERSYSLKEFLEGLHLHVEITEATEDQLSRVSQLTFRTNQFNFTTIRRSESEIKAFLKRDHARCLVVHVADRFGDYGLVGVAMCEAEGDRYRVDTLLLSCRVLGRGVEHALAAELGRRALKDGKQIVEFMYLPTARNQPALEFITSIGIRYRNQTDTKWTFPAKCLASVEYDPDEFASGLSLNPADTDSALDSPTATQAQRREPSLTFGWRVVGLSDRLQRIGEHLCDVGRLTQAIEQFRTGLQPVVSAADIAAADTMESALLRIWRKVLGNSRIELHDNFFEVGGTSLRAVQVIALIKKELKQNLSIVTLFECPSVALLAAKLGAATGGPQRETTSTEAALRGQRRRYKTTKQHASVGSVPK